MPSSTHKERANWFHQRASFPLRDAPPAELEKYWAAQNQAGATAGNHWEPMGPDNVAGRVTALAVDPKDHNKLFAGSAGGGVWISSDMGKSWMSSWSRFANQNIGALAIGPAWVGLIASTGEANLSAEAYPGNGVYCSNDEGLTWQPFFGPPPGVADPRPDEDVKTFPRRIGCVAFDRHGRIALGGVSHDDRMPAGLYLDQGGMGLQPCGFWGPRSYNCYSILFHPEDPKRIFTAIEPGGSQNGIWRSQDGGASWEHLAKGLPPGERFCRTSLVLAPSDPNVMYALAADRSRHVLGMFRSTDGGNSWREILGNRYPKERYMSYNNTVAVHPRNPDCVIWGGMKLYRTENGGRRWHQITTLKREARNYVHEDHHALVWPEDKLVLSGNDGGVSVSENGGKTWKERSRGMVSTMFYSLDVAPSNHEVFGGGTQDTGTLIAGVGGMAKRDFVPALTGDGAWMVFDPADEEHIFASASEFQVFRHRRGEAWDIRHWKFVQPRQISAEEKALRAINVLAVEPSTRRGIKKVWAGSYRLWRTDNDGRNWKPVSPSFDGTAISAIEISAVNRRVMFAGTSKGGIFRSSDGGKTWSDNLAGMDLPRRTVTSIQTHPKLEGTLAAVVGSTGMASCGLEIATGSELPYSHVFLSEDLGATWQDIDERSLPNVVYYAAAYQTQEPFALFVAGDAGVFCWSPQSRGWTNLTGNLPSVVVSDLVYHDKSRTLTVATYGRGIWRMSADEISGQPAMPGPVSANVPLAVGLREDSRVAAPELLSPEDGAVFDIFPRKTRLTFQTVPGALGYQAEIQVLSGNATVGAFSAASRIPEVTFEFAGAQPGRWRVWAILADSVRSRVSEWRGFTYLK